jgi:hypothetical protein
VSTRGDDNGTSGEEAADFEVIFEAIDDEEHPLDQVAGLDEALLWRPSETREIQADDLEFLGLDEIEWVEALTPTAPPPAAEILGEIEPADSDDPVEVAGEDYPPTPKATQTPAVPAGEHELAPRSPVGGLDALFAPDPATGLAAFTTLVSRLSGALVGVANNEGTVGLILVEVAPPEPRQDLEDADLRTVARGLAGHLGDRDLVARVGPNLFAVMVDLRPGVAELEAVQFRTIDALTAGFASSSGELRARAATARAEAGSTATAESLLRQAADELLGR